MHDCVKQFHTKSTIAILWSLISKAQDLSSSSTLHYYHNKQTSRRTDIHTNSQPPTQTPRHTNTKSLLLLHSNCSQHQSLPYFNKFTRIHNFSDFHRIHLIFFIFNISSTSLDICIIILSIASFKVAQYNYQCNHHPSSLLQSP